MKRIITMVCVLALALSSVAFNVSAAEPAAQPDSDFEFDYVPEGITKPTKEQIEKDYIFAGFTPESNDFLSTEMVTLASVRSVPVTEPCDQSWRDKYPTTWMWEANRTVTAADDMLTSR